MSHYFSHALYLLFNIHAELWDLDWIWVYKPNFMIISEESNHGFPRWASFEIIAYSMVLFHVNGLSEKDRKVVLFTKSGRWALIFALTWGRDAAVSMLGLSANEVTPHHAVRKLTRTSAATAALLSLLSHAGMIQNRHQRKGDSLSPCYL